jgi:hypothetical protein
MATANYGWACLEIPEVNLAKNQAARLDLRRDAWQAQFWSAITARMGISLGAR